MLDPLHKGHDPKAVKVPKGTAPRFMSDDSKVMKGKGKKGVNGTRHYLAERRQQSCFIVTSKSYAKARRQGEEIFGEVGPAGDEGGGRARPAQPGSHHGLEALVVSRSGRLAEVKNNKEGSLAKEPLVFSQSPRWQSQSPPSPMVTQTTRGARDE